MTDKKAFQTAELDCRSYGQGGMLVKIDDQAVFDFIKNDVLPSNAAR